MVLHQTMNVLNHGIKYDSDLTWDDSMLGSAPLVSESITIIFKNKTDAEKAYPGYEVQEWEVNMDLVNKCHNFVYNVRRST